MLDNLAELRDLDSETILSKLAALPGSYEGPDGVQPEPYGLMGYGEAVGLAGAFKTWIDAPLTLSGTQFLFAGGFDYEDAVPLKLSSELAGANVVLLGHGVHEPSLFVEPGPLGFYTYANYLGYATGHKEAVEEANTAMQSVLTSVLPEVDSNENPAKTLAWSLWNRVPLLLTNRQHSGLASAVQKVFARVGKSLSITLGEHPIEVATGAFEGRHEFGDDVVVLALGPEDEEMRLAGEVLETRVAQIETLTLPFGGVGTLPSDPGAQALVLWYLSAWVAAYLALLHKLDPSVNEVYDAVREAQLKK